MPVNPDTDGSAGDALFEPLETHYSHLADASVLVDLRKHPRFDTRFPAEAVSVDGRKTHATITNLSRSGLRLEGSRKMLDDLFPGFNRLDVHASIPMRVAFAVPAGTNRLRDVKVLCRSAYIRQENQDSWQIGMAITSFDAGFEALTRYLLSREDTD